MGKADTDPRQRELSNTDQSDSLDDDEALSLAGEDIVIVSPYSSLKIAAKAWGPLEGRRVLAVHGWLDNCMTWSGLAPYMVRAGFRLVGIDLPGHGLSDHHPRGNTYEFYSWMVELFAVADALHWTTFSLLGHSMGASIVAMAAGLYPERIENLVCIEQFGQWSLPAKYGPKNLQSHVKAAYALQLKTPRTYPDIDAAVEKYKQSNPTMQSYSVRTLLERSTMRTAHGVVFRHDLRMRIPALCRPTEEMVEEYLRRISCPTLVIIGDNGLPFVRALMDLRRPYMTNVPFQEVVLPGGHHLHLDSPEVLKDDVIRHLKGIAKAKL